MILSLGRNILESAFSWPLTARDRILRAHSPDGLNWQRDTNFVFSPFQWGKVPMAYYAARDDDGVMWFRVSVTDGEGSWKTLFYVGGQKITVDSAGLRHLFGPCWANGRLYGVGEELQKPGRWFVCLERDGAGFRQIEQNWERPDDLSIEDVNVVSSTNDNEWHAFATCRWNDRLTNIGSWTSSDRVRWRYNGIILKSPLTGGTVSLASNPCVVRTGTQQWRLYYRCGEASAVGSHLRSAQSMDLQNWSYDEGVRLEPSSESLWEHHGVAFPFVYASESGGWTMYYTGFWGASDAARVTAERWNAHSRQLAS